MKAKERCALWILTASLSISSAGCSVWKPTAGSPEKSWNPANWFKKEFQQPVSIATIWKADSIAEAGQPSQRGFGARVYFYNNRSQAIPVDGDLVVHGYLTTPNSRQKQSDECDKKFTFSAEQLAGQYSPTDLGASYNVWVPWDADGGFREEVTLVATFRSKQGSIVQSAPTRLFLPGQSRFPDEPKTPSGVQQVSYQQRTISTYDIAPSPTKPETRITTIEVPTEAHGLNEPQGVSVGGGGEMIYPSSGPTEKNYSLRMLPPPPTVPSPR